MQTKYVEYSSITLFKVKVIFAVCLYIVQYLEEFVFAPAALYIIYLLKVHCRSVSFDKLCK